MEIPSSVHENAKKRMSQAATLDIYVPSWVPKNDYWGQIYKLAYLDILEGPLKDASARIRRAAITEHMKRYAITLQELAKKEREEKEKTWKENQAKESPMEKPVE